MNDDLRLIIFVAVLLTLVLAEARWPRRERTVRRRWRWTANGGLAVLNTVAARFLLPVTVVGWAAHVEAAGWGLFSWFDLPRGVECVLAVLVLDFVIYLQHLLFHAVPWLWRLHRVHHADLDCDATTGVRFHTVEILLSSLIKLAATTGLGASPVAVMSFEILLNATALFNHANLSLPEWLDRGLRWFVVTPDMHRVHHSVIACETNTNFGFCVPWWDFLLRTYRAQPRDGHTDMLIGLPELRDERRVERLPALLALPFRSAKK